MKKILGILIIAAGIAIAYFLDFTLISDIIAVGAIILGGKVAASD